MIPNKQPGPAARQRDRAENFPERKFRHAGRLLYSILRLNPNPRFAPRCHKEMRRGISNEGARDADI